VPSLYGGKFGKRRWLKPLKNKGIVFLKQAKENTIRRLSTVEAAVQMLNETKSIVFDTLMEKELDIIGNVLKHVPVYELCCNISKEAVELVKDTIFRE